MNRLWTNLKSWYGVLFLVLLAGVVVWTVLNGMPYFNKLRANWEVQRLQNQWEKPYREDKYGGKTPEETFDMFLDALRKEDVVLASKYFVVDKQERWLKTLEEYKKGNVLSGFVKELEHTQTIWEKLSPSDSPLFKETISYEYTTVVEKATTVDFEDKKLNVPAGSYANSTTFGLNVYTKVWKISSL